MQFNMEHKDTMHENNLHNSDQSINHSDIFIERKHEAFSTNSELDSVKIIRL